MSANDDLERRIADFYAAEVVPRSPDRVLRSVLETVDTTPQGRTPVRPPWKFLGMNNSPRLATAAVAVVAVGAIGLALLRPDLPGIGAGISPSPSTLPSPSTSPSASPVPSPSAAMATTFRHPFRYQLPAGAEFDYGTRNETYWEVRVPAAAAAGHPAGIIVQEIGGGQLDPCAATSSPLHIGWTPQGVIDYLKTVRGLQVSDEGTAAVGPLPAFQARVRAEPETSTCPEIWPWVEDTEAFSAIPRGAAVRMLAVIVADEHLVLTVYGEDDNPSWKAMAGEFIRSIRFPPGLQPLPGSLLPWSEVVRVEPRDPSIVNRTAWAETAGDGLPEPVDTVDITSLRFDAPCYNAPICVYFELAGEASAPLRDPADEWVAYGLVVDNDGDGVPDAQAGIDNAWDGPRAWRTNLQTGETLVGRGTTPSNLSVEGNVPWLIEPVRQPMRGWVGVGRSLAEPLLHFYLWAAVIRDGEVVSIDYAPDAGWLDADRR